MTVGALIFAFDNDHIDYLAMAAWTANNIRRHLDIPVAVVTDQSTGYDFDQVILCENTASDDRWFDDFATKMPWHNRTRAQAYELSPWDQTLVLDADFVVASDQLRTVLESDQDFLAHRWAYDITGQDDFRQYNYFGYNHMPMWWATVMMFRRSLQAQLIFESMTMVRDNWTHYRNLYKNPRPTYRNDHALSIALNIVDGHTASSTSIPWSLASLIPAHQLTQLQQDSYRVDFVNSQGKPRWIELQGQDFHAMGKQHLGAIVASHS